MARSAMVNRVAVMAAAVTVAVAMSAGNAEARRASVAASESVVGVTLWGRLAEIGGRISPIKVYGKAGWNDFALRRAAADGARIRLREARLARR